MCDKQKKENELTRRNKSKIVISLKSDNQGLITLAYNLIFYFRIKYINIQQPYICGKIGVRQIKLFNILSDQIITNSLTKALINIKFHGFIDQIKMN